MQRQGDDKAAGRVDAASPAGRAPLPAMETASESLAALNLKAMPRILARLTRLSFRYPGHCLAALGCALGATIFNLVIPHLLGRAVDQAFQPLSSDPSPGVGWPGPFVATAFFIVGASALRGLLTAAQGYLGETIAQQVGCDLRLAFFEKLQRLSFSYHDAVHSGELMTRGMLDLEGVRAFLESGLLRVVTLILLLGVGSWHVMRSDPVTGLLALSFVPFVVWRAANMGARLRVSWMRLQAMMSELTRTMEENLQGARVVRSFAAGPFELARFDISAKAALSLSNRRITLRMGSMSVMNLAYYTAMGLVLGIGGNRVTHGQMTVGGLTAVLAFMTILQQPVRQVGMVVNAGARAASSGARLFEVLDLAASIVDAPDAKALVVGAGVLRFDRVSFDYPKGQTGAAAGESGALRDISFVVGLGRTLGIVGPPGSGKSTIAHLIPRFYDVTGGQITIDGQDIRTITLDSLRHAVGLIQQDMFLFDASVRDNVAYADPWTEETEVREASAIAQIHDHVAALPEGYQTRVGERGVALSGGQRQRLSIARGLVANPAIIVFDDSTAAVDATTERLIYAGLRSAMQAKAMIIIAHRLGSLRHADEIIVLDQGRIIERGTHDGLLRAGGAYAALWRLQGQGHDAVATSAAPGVSS